MLDDFTEFATERTPHLYRSALLLCGDHHGAWDLTQEALASVYVAWLRRPQAIEQPAAYAQRVLLNSYISKRRRRATHEIPTDEVVEVGYQPGDLTLRLSLIEALNQLTSVDRAVIVLRYYEDLSVEDTADLIGISPGAVRNRAMRTLAKLRDTMPLELKEQL